jgi:DNA-binding transcriptional ArsR family regulator
MAKEKFILVDLKDDDSKKLAQVISNESSRKILDYLADGDATESDIAEELGIPISTVHYNLQALLKAKMVETEEFHYSKKGKEMLHYSLANQCVIIAPKKTEELRKRLRNILSIGVIAFLGSAVLYFKELFHMYASGTFGAAMESVASGGARTVGEGAIEKAAEAAVEAVPAALPTAVATGGGMLAEDMAAGAVANASEAMMYAQYTGPGKAAAEAVAATPVDIGFWQSVFGNRFVDMFVGSPAAWFLLGGLAVMAALMIFELVRYNIQHPRKKKGGKK